MTNAELAAQAEEVLFNNYTGFRDMALVRGNGVRVWDADGREYLDMLAGIATCSLGHCHPKIVQAVNKQVETLIHVSNLFLIEPQIRVAKRLVELSFADKAFFCNSGTESVECSLKLARKYGTTKKGPECYKIIAAQDSFHGRTFGSISVTGQEKYHKGFKPLLPGVKFVPFNDVKALEEAMTDDVCGVILEPIQGESGVLPSNKEYLEFARAKCTEKNAVLIFDEVQSGMGRTGKLFAYENYGVEPDVMTLAKALGGGLPVGAVLARDEFAEVLGPGTHAATFGGNPLVMAAAEAALELLVDDGLIDRSLELGTYFKEKLQGLVNDFDSVTEVRGMGLMIGVVVGEGAGDIMKAMREKNILCGTATDAVVRFVPPFVIDREDIDRTVEALREVLKKVAG